MRKKICILLLLLPVWSLVVAQNYLSCETVVEAAVEAVNSKNSALLEPYLADDFSMAGYSGERAKQILKVLLAQLNETVSSYEEAGRQTEGDRLTCRYNFEYARMGSKEVVFVFDAENKLKDLSLIAMQVKTMNTNETKVDAGAEHVIRVPFNLLGRLIAVQVMLDGESRTFLLDTGAPSVILNTRHIAGRDTVWNRSQASIQGFGGGISGMDIRKVGQLDLQGIRLKDQETPCADLSRLEERFGAEIYGLIGYNLIKDYDILFDYEAQQITLIRSGFFDEYVKQELSGKTLTRIPLEMQGHIPVVDVEIGGRTSRFGIDSGAEGNVVNERLFAEIREQIRDISEEEVEGVGGNVQRTLQGVTDAFRIGNKTFGGMPVIGADLSNLNEKYDGLIGYEVLSRQKTLISFNRSELVFIE